MELNVKHYATAIVATIIMVLLTVSVLVPVTDNAIDSQREEYNNTTDFVAKLADGESRTFQYTYSSTTVTEDGVNVTPSSAGGLVFTNSCLIIWFPTNIELYGEGITNFVSIKADATIQITGTEVIVTYSGTTKTFEYTWGYVRDSDGEYGMFRHYNTNRQIYLNSIDDIKGANYLATTGKWFSYEGATVNIEDEEIEAQYDLKPISGMANVSTLRVGSTGDYSFVVDNAGSQYTVHPWITVAPIKVVGDTDIGSNVNGILGLIPILVLAGLTIGVVGMFITRRD